MYGYVMVLLHVSNHIHGMQLHIHFQLQSGLIKPLLELGTQMSKEISYKTMDLITNPCPSPSWTISVKGSLDSLSKLNYLFH